MKTLSVQLKEWRDRAQLSQAQLAEQVGVTQSAVSLWESGGRIKLNRLSRLIEALGLTETESGLLRLEVIALYEAARPAA